MSKLDNIKIPDSLDEAINVSIDKALNDKKKINLHKRKRLIAGIPGLFILGGLIFTSETTWAYIDGISRKIEEHFGKNNNEFEKYKFEGDLVSEYDGLKFSIGELMLDDRQLIISMSAEYSKPKWFFKEVVPEYPTVTIGDFIFSGQACYYDTEKVAGEKKINILYKMSLTSIDTDGDGYSDTNFELLDNINKNEEYDLNIRFDKLKSGDEGKWEFNSKFNASTIIDNTKVYKVDKKIKIDRKEYKGELVIEEVRISPFSVKVKYNYDLYEKIPVKDRREPGIIIKDENGNRLEFGPGEGGELVNKRWYIGNEYLLKGNEKKIEVMPVSYIVDDEETIYEDGIVEIDLK